MGDRADERDAAAQARGLLVHVGIEIFKESVSLEDGEHDACGISTARRARCLSRSPHERAAAGLSRAM
jgi:hypothetical protein